ncbi:hypothetical protein A5647_18135 [Mycobacterium sp. 1100029.7]|nr:hypothetical protein A5647_18135 [Mycobacterium sp. 1100029.7]
MNTPRDTRPAKRFVAGAMLSGAAAFAALTLGAGTAQAFSYPIAVCNGMTCSAVWCPGMPVPEAADGLPNWDMKVCHHFMVGQIGPHSPPWVTNGGVNRQVSPMVIEGDPGACPGCIS